MKIYRVIREECKCYMACNTYQIHDIENIFLRRYSSIHTVQNDFFTISMKYLLMGQGISLAMPYDCPHNL